MHADKLQPEMQPLRATQGSSILRESLDHSEGFGGIHAVISIPLLLLLLLYTEDSLQFCVPQ